MEIRYACRTLYGCAGVGSLDRYDHATKIKEAVDFFFEASKTCYAFLTLFDVPVGYSTTEFTVIGEDGKIGTGLLKAEVYSEALKDPRAMRGNFICAGHEFKDAIILAANPLQIQTL